MYVACGKSTPPVASPVVQVTPPPVKTASEEVMVVADDNWEFTLPSKKWVPVPNAPEAITRALINNTLINLILFVKEPFSGTFQQYALFALNDVKESGAIVISAQEKKIHDLTFIVLEIMGETGINKTWMFISYLSDHGYLFACTAPIAKQEDSLCFSIASTLKIQ